MNKMNPQHRKELARVGAELNKKAIGLRILKAILDSLPEELREARVNTLSVSDTGAILQITYLPKSDYQDENYDPILAGELLKEYCRTLKALWSRWGLVWDDIKLGYFGNDSGYLKGSTELGNYILQVYIFGVPLPPYIKIKTETKTRAAETYDDTYAYCSGRRL